MKKKTIAIDETTYVLGELSFGQMRLDVFGKDTDPFQSDVLLLKHSLNNGDNGQRSDAYIVDLPFAHARPLLLAALELNGLRTQKKGEAEPAQAAG